MILVDLVEDFVDLVIDLVDLVIDLVDLVKVFVHFLALDFLPVFVGNQEFFFLRLLVFGSLATCATSIESSSDSIPNSFRPKVIGATFTK